MKRLLPVLLLLAGCSTSPPRDASHSTEGTVAYAVLVESSEPARIEANGENEGNTPLTLTLYGDADGTFHNFNRDEFVITAYPLVKGKAPVSKFFMTGGRLSFDSSPFRQEDRIPKRIYFDLEAAPPGTTGTPATSIVNGKFELDVPQNTPH